MIHSFRLRIALLAAGLAGSTLIGFGLISWKLIYDAKVSRLDASLENQLIRAGRPRAGDRWQMYESLLPRDLGVNANTSIALLVLGNDQNQLYQSANWSSELNSKSLFPPRPDAPAFPPPPEGKPLDPINRPTHPPDLPPPDISQFTRYSTIGNWRVGATSFPRIQVAIAVSLTSIDQEMEVIRNIFLFCIPVVLLLIAGGAWSLSGSALQPIRQLTATIQTVTSKGLSQRVSSSASDDEFIELIQVFNQMLERLESNFKQASRFSADAAHELKTPLTILQGELEQALQQAETGSELQQRLGNLQDEVRRLAGIVRKLLLLSLADAGRMSLHLAEVNLSAMLLEMVNDLDLLAPDLKVQTAISKELYLWADQDLLTQVLQNLFSNAIKYNLPDGWINVSAIQKTTTVVVTLSNASKDIPDRDRQLIFERFQRGDPARTRKVEGTGLGLSLAREIVRAHGGNLILEPLIPGQTTFTLSLPIGQKPFHKQLNTDIDSE